MVLLMLLSDGASYASVQMRTWVGALLLLLLLLLLFLLLFFFFLLLATENTSKWA